MPALSVKVFPPTVHAFALCSILSAQSHMESYARRSQAVKPLLSCVWTCAEQAQTLQKRCSELEEQLQADKSELGALQKQAAEHLASQTATPRKV